MGSSTPAPRVPGDGGDRREALLALARRLGRQARAGTLTDLEALARLVEWRAAVMTGPGVRERWRLVVDLAAVTTEIDARVLPPRRHGQFVAFGQRGFRAAYHSLDAGSGNQVRHLTAFMLAGFLLPRPLGWALSLAAEAAAALVRRHPIDWPDAWLGCEGATLGAALRGGSVAPAAAGDWLRRVLGEPVSTALPGAETRDGPGEP